MVSTLFLFLPVYVCKIQESMVQKKLEKSVSEIQN
jgi:hypothetical protein